MSGNKSQFTASEVRAAERSRAVVLPLHIQRQNPHRFDCTAPQEITDEGGALLLEGGASRRQYFSEPRSLPRTCYENTVLDRHSGGGTADARCECQGRL